MNNINALFSIVFSFPLTGGLCYCCCRSAIVASSHMAGLHACKRQLERDTERERELWEEAKESRGGGRQTQTGGAHRHNGERFFWVFWGRLADLRAPLFAPPPGLMCQAAVGCPRHLDIIYNRQENWMGRTHELDNPGNNMRTLSLSRTLAEDLHCCRLP